MSDLDLALVDSEACPPNSYSLWAVERTDSNAPLILIAVFEWKRAGVHGVRIEGVWLSEEEDPVTRWEDYPEYNQICGGADGAGFAELVEQGKAHRIGPLPATGRYANPFA